MDSNIITDLLYRNAENCPDAVIFRYLGDTGSESSNLTNMELLKEAQRVAEFLASVTAPGSRIMLFFAPGLDFVKAFFGCLLAGMVPVPLHPPRRSAKSDRLIKVALDCKSTIALTSKPMLLSIQSLWQSPDYHHLALRVFATDDVPRDFGSVWARGAASAATTAFIQYTSGSTGAPKGVAISHGNISANMNYLRDAAAGSERDVFVNWLPHFHDMGLIITVLWPVFLGATSILMAPTGFVRNPVAWLRAISQYRGTICGAPNFAYDLCVEKISNPDEFGFDLTGWEVAFNSAEPVRAQTIDNFSRHFAGAGFNSKAFYPCYGMAEATVFISGGRRGNAGQRILVTRASLVGTQIKLADDQSQECVQLVSCGHAIPPHDIRIVDPGIGQGLDEGHIGEIWFSGPSLSSGYWQLEKVNEKSFGQCLVGETGVSGKYFKTGDLGVMLHGELYVIGRIKDLIIRNGKNYYPQDIEGTATKAHPAIRPGGCAAFAVDQNGVENVVVLAEVRRQYVRSVDLDLIAQLIRSEISREHELSVSRVILVKPYKVPLTSSGKVERSRARHLFLSEMLDSLHECKPNSNNWIAPVSPTEQILHNIWSRILKVEKVSCTKNFFEMGGNSLDALEICAAICENYRKLDLDSDELITFATIVSMANYIDTKSSQQEKGMQSGRSVVHI